MRSEKRYLVLKGCAGLGNRLYTVCAAIEYSLRTDRILYVDWCDGQFNRSGENAFYKHFELSDVPHLVNSEELKSVAESETYPSSYDDIQDSGIYNGYLQDSSNRLQRIPQRLIGKGSFSKVYGYWRKKESRDQVVTRSDWSCLKAIFNPEHFVLGQFLQDSRKERLVVFADFCPPFDFDYFQRHIHLKPGLQKEIEDFVEDHELSNAIGIHIRNTDKKPTSSFQKLRDALKDFDFQSVFLATDNPNVEEEISSWGYPVKSQHKFMPEGKRGLHQWALDEKRDDVKEQMFKESIIDMYALSRCKFLLYQGNSSFSCMSNLMRGQVQAADWQTF